MNTSFQNTAKLFIGLCLLCLTFSSCYSHRLVAHNDSDRIILQKKTNWTYLWGLVESNDVLANCPEESMTTVVIKDNLLYNTINVISLGLVNPVMVEWQCSPESTSDSDIIGLANSNRER